MNEPMVCSICGSARLGTIQRGIDNLPVALCYDCRDRRSPKKQGGLNAGVVPVMPVASWRAPEKPKAAEPTDMWSLLPQEEQKRLQGHRER